VLACPKQTLRQARPRETGTTGRVNGSKGKVVFLAKVDVVLPNAVEIGDLYRKSRGSAIDYVRYLHIKKYSLNRGE
jgi:hypothetical protein